MKAAYFWIAADVNIGRKAQSKHCFEINPSFLCHVSFRPRRAEWALSKIRWSAWPAGSIRSVAGGLTFEADERESSFPWSAHGCEGGLESRLRPPSQGRQSDFLLRKGSQRAVPTPQLHFRVFSEDK